MRVLLTSTCWRWRDSIDRTENAVSEGEGGDGVDCVVVEVGVR